MYSRESTVEVYVYNRGITLQHSSVVRNRFRTLPSRKMTNHKSIKFRMPNAAFWTNERRAVSVLLFVFSHHLLHQSKSLTPLIVSSLPRSLTPSLPRSLTGRPDVTTALAEPIQNLANPIQRHQRARNPKPRKPNPELAEPIQNLANPIRNPESKSLEQMLS